METQDIVELKVTLAKIEVTLQKNTESLIEHVRRTDLLESQVKLINDEVRPLLPQIKLVLKWWPILSVAVIAMLAGKPDLVQALIKQFTGVTP